ncbi:MAG: GNAT family N-acetyltransferase [Burkholderiales bacterium]|nr:GNAT family N-acetyltransferase [Burkholderiales bacterium]
MTVVIRKAGIHELPWINEKYREVEFLPSEAGDLIAIATVDGKPAGIGRVVSIADGSGELGGMYVFKEFRRYGIARSIIDFLIREGDCRQLYCLPFAELEPLYRSAGFTRLAATEEAPAKVLDKYRWCNEFYPSEVLLMKLSMQNAPA